MILLCKGRFLDSHSSELWGAEVRGSNFRHKWCRKMLLYLTQIKLSSHETWAVDSLDSLISLRTKVQFCTYLVVEHFAFELQEMHIWFDASVEAPVSHSNISGS